MVKDIVMSIVISIAISIKSFPAYLHVIKTVYQQQLLQLHLQPLQLWILLINAILIAILPAKVWVFLNCWVFLCIFRLKTLIRQDWFRKISMFNGLPLFLFSDNHNDHDHNNSLRSHCCLRRVMQQQLRQNWKSLSTKSLSFNMLQRLLYNDNKSFDNNNNASDDNHNSSFCNVSHELRNSLCAI